MSDAELVERVTQLEDEVESLKQGPTAHTSLGDSSSVEQRNRIKEMKQVISLVEAHSEDGAPLQEVYSITAILDVDHDIAKEALENLRKQGEIYEPRSQVVRTT